jgi:hypothetical protein
LRHDWHTKAGTKGQRRGAAHPSTPTKTRRHFCLSHFSALPFLLILVMLRRRGSPADAPWANRAAGALQWQ